MATPVQAIYNDQPGSLPATYDTPASLDMEFASSRLKFDGSGASGSFIVVLEALTNDGKIMVQARTDQVFPAGSTGVVSFAPFLRRRLATSSVLQVYYGLPTAGSYFHPGPADSWHSSGYPSNPSFTKLSSTSGLFYVINCDVRTGGGLDNVAIGVYIGSTDEENIYGDIQVPNGLITLGFAKLAGSSVVGPYPYAAGTYTLDVQFYSRLGTAPELLTNGGSDFMIMEVEQPWPVVT